METLFLQKDFAEDITCIFVVLFATLATSYQPCTGVQLDITETDISKHEQNHL